MKGSNFLGLLLLCSSIQLYSQIPNDELEDLKDLYRSIVECKRNGGECTNLVIEFARTLEEKAPSREAQNRAHDYIHNTVMAGYSDK